jgi:DNA-binding NtrC family response regulator
MKTILVVDDEYGIGELLEAILSDEGYRVITAINGRQALEQLAANRVDMVLSDLMMPVMDGAALLKALKLDERHMNLPFVLMCSLPATGIAHRIDGYTGFIQKPFQVHEVVSLVRRIVAE